MVVRYSALGALCVALGAVTTTAIAWGVAFRGLRMHDRDPGSPQPVALVLDQEREAFVFSAAERYWGCTVLATYRWPVESVSGRFVTVLPQGGLYLHIPEYPLVDHVPDNRHLPLGDSNSRHEFQFGWPLPSFWAADDVAGSGCIVEFQPPVHVLRLSNKKGQPWDFAFWRFDDEPPGCVPTAILPLGFAIDTGALASAWCAVFLMPKRITRFVRRRRGQCPHCAYPRTGLASTAPCPECGLR